MTLSGAELMERALHPQPGEPSDAPAVLVALAGGLRPPLEEAQRLLVGRLHGRSDDFEATRALGALGTALSRIGWKLRPAPTRRRWNGRQA